MSRIVATNTRVPRIQALPWQTWGSRVMWSRQFMGLPSRHGRLGTRTPQELHLCSFPYKIYQLVSYPNQRIRVAKIRQAARQDRYESHIPASSFTRSFTSVLTRSSGSAQRSIRDFSTRFALASHNLAPFFGSDAAGRTDFRCIRWRYIPVALPAASAQHR